MLCKVLFITHHYPPDIGAGSNRSQHVVRALRQRGLHVDVLTSKPVYPNPTLYRRHQGWKRNNDDKQGRVRYLFAFSHGHSWFPIIYRLLNQIVFFMLACFYIFRKGSRYQLVVTSSPPFLINAIGLLAKSVYHCKWVLEIRDLWPDSLHAVGKMSKSNLLFKLLKRMELSFYKKSDGVVLLAPGMTELLEASDLAKEKISTITNGVPEWIDKRREDYTVNGPLTVRYIGTIGYAQDFAPLLEMAEKNPGVRFELIGEGLYKKELQEIIEERSLSNVHLKDGMVNKDKILEAYLTADFGYIGLKPHEVFAHVIPSKLFEYGAVGVPVLYYGPVNSDCGKIIREYKLGQVLSYSNQVDAVYLQWTIDEYCKNADVENFLKDYSWQAIGDRYYKFLSRGCLHERQRMHDGVESFYN